MSEDLIVRNVTVIDGSGGPPIANAEVAIEGERFTAIRSAGTRNAGEVYDARGGYLLPGLWEGHTHLGARPGETAQDQFARLEAILGSYLEAGITTVLELGGSLDINTRFRDRTAATPPSKTANFLFAGPTFCGVDGWPVTLHHNHALVRETAAPESAQRMVLETIDKTDFVKCHYHGEPGAPDKLPRAVLAAIVTAAHEHGQNVLVHIRTKQDIEDVVDAGADGVEHAFLPRDPDDIGEAEEVAALLAATGTYYCPTLAVFEQIGRSGDPAYLDELVRDGIISREELATFAAHPNFGAPFPDHPAAETLARLKYAMRTLRLYRDAGVKISAGSDVAMFMSRPAALLRELQLLAYAGLALSDVVVAGTRHSAEKIGKAAPVGTIATGARADALLLNANPLEDVMHLVRPVHRLGTIRCGQLAVAVGAPFSR
jgi:imidazolonepropionase-like amidohydrolase